MKNLNLFTWLLECSGNAAKIGLIPCQLRQQDGKNTAKTRQKDGKSSIYRRIITLLTLLLTLGVGQMWAWNQIYLVGDPCVNNSSKWTDQNYAMPETSNNSGERYIFIYMEKDWYFKFRVNNKPVGNDYPGVSFTSYNSGARMYKWNDNDPYAAKYSGLNTGIVRICTKQESNASGEGNTDEKPWVWLLRPKIMIRHNWGGSSWSDQQMTDNQDGTYTYDGNWGGNYTYVGVTDEEYNENGSNCYKKFQNIATVYGNPSNGNACVFEYDATNYASIGGSTANTGTLVIRAYCSINYDGNDKTGGNTPANQTNQRAGIELTLQTNSNSLAKSGYTLTGWNTATDGSGTHYDLGASYTPNNVNTTLYAEWTASITLDKNGGSTDGRATTLYKSSNKLTITSAPSPATGYYVTGYYAETGCTTLIAEADGTLVAGVTGYTDVDGKWIATEDKTLYAKWDNHYTVTFEQGSPTFQGTGDVTATYGAALPAISVPSKTGYIFGGYYTGENGTGKQYYNENGVGLINWVEAANTTLHAKWTGISYQVAFDANEGSGTIDNQDFTYGAAATALTSNTTQITRTGYYFLGWNTNADGSGTAFYNGKSVQNLTSVDGGIVTLYAQWAKTHTLFFVLAGIGWNPPYAKAQISYDGQTYYPITGSNVWSAMTSVSKGIYLRNVSNGGSHSFSLYKIEGIPVGAQIDFSSNSSGTSNVGFMSWTPEKPYFMYGNKSWYGIDKYAVNPANKDTIVQATEMSVAFGSTLYGIDEHGDDGKYAIVNLSADTWYTNLKYYNWIANGWSGCTATGDASNMITSSTSTGVSGEWTLNGSNHFCIQTTVAGEYKFVLTGYDEGAPKAQIYYPVGVSLGALNVTQALAGEETTVTLTATPAKTYLMTNPTYYYQMSTDGGTNWTTIATSSSKTYAYTFAARACKFRVMLQNDAGLRSKSNEQSFTAYSTKSFYVYNPYNTSGNWSYLHLYTWDSNNGNTRYNGDFPTGSPVSDCGYIHGVDNATPSNCRNGNNLRYVGNNWFYITIDERANCFMLVGEATYKDHQTVTCYTNGYIEGGKYMIYTQNNQNKVVEYQAKGASDFRLKYTSTSPSVTRYSDIYNTTLDGTSVIASMWMDASATSPTLVIQRGNGTNSWTDAVTYSGTDFTGLIPSDHRDYGYVFQMDLNLSTPAVSNVTEYTGPFYVRTDGLEGGWNAYKNNPKNTMHHSSGSLTGTPAYDYYLCKWIGTANTNIKFTVANDYNKELVASLEGDVNSSDPLYNRQTVPTPTNVRFSWDSQTNTLTRAYLSGATDASSRFLVMVEKASDAGYTTGKIYNENGVALTSAAGGQVSGLNEHELLFADNGNWVYQLDMKANPGAQAKVTAKYNNQEPEFIPTTTLIDGSGESMYKYRITYDFKTNIMTNAWVADGTQINTTINLNTNVMIIRNGQAANGVTQIRFESGKEIINAKKLISVMEFKYNDMVGTMNTWNTAAYQFCMYYISFPFDVNVSDIFGIGTYGTDWKLQYYDGAERASKGFFRGDGTTTFWKDVPANGKLDKHVGYSLLLNRVKFNDRTSDIWENKGAGSSVYLYFPSTADAETIKDDGTVTIHVPEHKCEINRTFTVDDGNGGTKTLNHMNTDSHWNMMGTPLFEHKTASTIVAPEAINDEILQYFYAWNYADNTLAARATLANGVQTFNAMYAYMVQYAGDVTFSGAAIHPASIAARRTAETRNLNIELQVLNANEEEINRTYVQLKDGADADFKLNEDMYMVTNSRAVNIYTYAGDYDVAANVLPLETTIVPVGVMVKTAGSYTFSMPSDFSGTVTLVDSFAQTRTNLAVEDYTVDLEKGTFNDRFLLEININKVPTAIDGVPGGSLKDGKAHKFIENGAMYILQDGKIYDARGNRLQ